MLYVSSVLVAISILSLSACGGGFACDFDSRDGTYLLTWEERSGTCGPIEDTLVVLGGVNEEPGVECELNQESLSEDECVLDRTVTCTDTLESTVTTAVATTEQMSPNGDYITGTISITTRDLNSSTTVCTGVYSVEYHKE